MLSACLSFLRETWVWIWVDVRFTCPINWMPRISAQFSSTGVVMRRRNNWQTLSWNVASGPSEEWIELSRKEAAEREKCLVKAPASELKLSRTTRPCRRTTSPSPRERPRETPRARKRQEKSPKGGCLVMLWSNVGQRRYPTVCATDDLP